MTWNENLRDNLISHQIDLMGFARYEARQRIKVLNSADKELAGIIATADISISENPGAWREFKRLQKEIAIARAEAWKEIADDMESSAETFAAEEAKNIRGVYVASTSGAIIPALPSTDLVKATALSRPFDGAVLREWASRAEQQDVARIHRTIQIGMTLGQNPRKIASTVIGTRSARYADGVTRQTRTQIEALTRTAVNHISNQAQDLFSRENPYLSQDIFLATLDGRTTKICASLDGKVYEKGEGPIPPLHFACRSRRSSYFDAALLGERPYNDATEKAVFKAWKDETGIRASSYDKLPRGTKTQFKKFRAGFYRDKAGAVPSKVSYSQFLRSRSAQFQDDYLGPTRAKLFREGGLEISNFVAADGQDLTLADLSRKHRRAFVDAGLNPDNY